VLAEYESITNILTTPDTATVSCQAATERESGYEKFQPISTMSCEDPTHNEMQQLPSLNKPISRIILELPQSTTVKSN